MEGKGISAKGAEIDWSSLMRFKKTFTEPVPQNIEKRYAKAGIVTYHGHTRFLDRTTVQAGDDTLAGRFVLIASGAMPAALDIPGEARLIRSDQFLELEQLPQRIVFSPRAPARKFESFIAVLARWGASIRIS